MSHVYQPLLIRLLLESGGKATVRQLALVLSWSSRARELDMLRLSV
jgi:hypothetical protein